jgi:hypothetical protein
MVGTFEIRKKIKKWSKHFQFRMSIAITPPLLCCLQRNTSFYQPVSTILVLA